MQTFATLRTHSKRLLILTIILIVGVTACDTDGGVDLFGAQPTQLDAQSAQQVASTFLDAWTTDDYETMYGLISPNARSAFSQERFVEIYEDTDTLLTIEDLKYNVNSVMIQGTTAVVDYRVDLDTQLMGKFSVPTPTDTEPRVMRLITTPEGWRIAWSRNDIFAGWTNNSYIDLDRTTPVRGNIYDRNGLPLAVQNGISIQLQLVRNNIPNLEDCVAVLGDVLRRENAEIFEDINGYALDTKFFIGDISQDSLTQNQSRLNASCRIDSAPRTTRQYYDGVAPHLIGYVAQIPAERRAEFEARGYPANALVGLEGIEQAFEHRLAGTIGVQLVIRSNTGVNIRAIASRPAQPGEDVYLTIDRQLQLDVQWLLADAYTQGVNTWSTESPGAAVVVMDVNTGEVLAMASYPDFDSGVFNPDTPVWDPGALIGDYSTDVRRPLLNRATQGRYPLGSVFKIFSNAAGLDSGIWSPTETVTCNGIWDGTVYGSEVKTDWLAPPGHGVVNAESALMGSCNPFFWTLGVTLNQSDPNILPDYVMQFGFGSAPPLQGVATDAGNIPNPEWKLTKYGTNWTNSDAANLVIGQGETAVNPLQVARGVAAVANGGMLWNPMVVQKIQVAGQTAEVFEPIGEQMAIDPNTFTQLQTAMCRVTGDPDGTAYFMFGEEWYDVIGYQIDLCGKTGTAESGGKPHAWFSAYAPADNPEIAIAVIVENSCEGSEVSAPITRRILEKYYNLNESYDWPNLWWTGCTEIGPGLSGP